MNKALPFTQSFKLLEFPSCTYHCRIELFAKESCTCTQNETLETACPWCTSNLTVHIAMNDKQTSSKAWVKQYESLHTYFVTVLFHYQQMIELSAQPYKHLPWASYDDILRVLEKTESEQIKKQY